MMKGGMISKVFSNGFLSFLNLKSVCQTYSDSDSLKVTQEAHLG